ncbi:MAG: alkaline phosphatase D family protein [Thermoleophilaceae bacterium]
MTALTRSLPIAVAAALLLAPPALAAKGFSLGVAAGEVSSSSAVLWAHATGSGSYTLQVAAKKNFKKRAFEKSVKASSGNDNTVQAKAGKLKPGKRYYYRFVGKKGRRSDTGTFRTAPKASANATFEFGWTGDTDFNAAPGQSAPFWNTGGVFKRMRAEKNAFNIHFGDTMYSDSEIPGALQPIALTVKAKWAKYRTNLENQHLRGLRGSAAFFSHWDDHEFVNDFSPKENTFSNDVNINGRTLYKRGVDAFRDYAPVRWSAQNGLYRRVRWGRNAELFFLDQRSFRSAKADEGGVCTTSMTGEPDVAPTAPQSVRNTFALVLPSLAQPVPQSCLDAIRSERRTYLGARQLARFIRDIRASDARFKIVMNELPIQQYYVLPYDRWEGYEAERQQVLRALQNVKNVVFLTTDVHATLVNDARFQTLEAGGPRNSGILDITVGPAATANLELEIETEVGVPGAGALVDSAFFEPQPSAGGVGKRCSILDQFSYGQVKVTANRLTITPRGINGQPQQNAGRPCGPFVLNFTK